jgi:hypothetical protein
MEKLEHNLTFERSPRESPRAAVCTEERSENEFLI